MTRITFLLRYAGLTPGSDAPVGAVTEMRSGKRLQAVDFWMRNPDYLTDALLDEYEAGRLPTALASAARIFEDREPELRRLPMMKWRFGAYEPLDDILAPLILHGLVDHRATVRVNDSVAEHTYWLMPEGSDFCDALVASDPQVFGWYRDRAKLIATVAKDTAGSTLKDQQYERIEYAGTRGRAFIPAITDIVRTRLRDARAAAA